MPILPRNAGDASAASAARERRTCSTAWLTITAEYDPPLVVDMYFPVCWTTSCGDATEEAMPAFEEMEEGRERATELELGKVVWAVLWMVFVGLALFGFLVWLGRE